MTYTRNAVYSAVTQSVGETYPNVYCTSRYVAKPASFPCLYLREIDRFPRRAAMTLAADDVQNESTFEAQVFSNKVSGAMAEAQAIADVVFDAFRNMYYRQTSQTVIDDGTIYTIISRFRRVIGGGDTATQED